MDTQCRRLAIAFLFAAIMCAATGQVSAFWSMPGTTGTVDESGASKLLLNDTGSASIRSSVTGMVRIRYAVTVNHVHAPWDDPDPDWKMCMRLMVRDTGPGSRVLARLKRIAYWTGEQMTLGSFDSDVWLSEQNDQYQATGSCDLRDPDANGGSGGRLLNVDLSRYSYYVEVDLIKTDLSGNPGIKQVMLVTEEL